MSLDEPTLASYIGSLSYNIVLADDRKNEQKHSRRSKFPAKAVTSVTGGTFLH